MGGRFQRTAVVRGRRRPLGAPARHLGGREAATCRRCRSAPASWIFNSTPGTPHPWSIPHRAHPLLPPRSTLFIGVRTPSNRPFLTPFRGMRTPSNHHISRPHLR
eukprot:165857-Prorocentrum_minimum.AAC.1